MNSDASLGFVIIIGGIVVGAIVVRWVFRGIVRGVTRISLEEASKIKSKE